MKMFKHPRTFHLPWSESISSDDKIINSLDHFKGRQVVVTEKRDGENTTLYPTGQLHARSIQGNSYEWQSPIKAMWAAKSYLLPEGWRVVGENLYASHSVRYDLLDSWFEVFAIIDENNVALSWDDTEIWCLKLGLTIVPVLSLGIWDESQLKQLVKSIDTTKQEGFVVRVRDKIPMSDWGQWAVKWVRANHVQSDQHWTKTWKPNQLR